MGFTGLFAALADVLAPAAAEAAPAAFGAATGGVVDAGLIGGAVPGAIAAGAGPVIDAGLIGGAVPGALAGGAGGVIDAGLIGGAVPGAIAADIVPEATGAGLSGLGLETGGSSLAAGGVGAAGATPATGLGTGFSGVLGAGPGGPFGDLSALLAPTGQTSLLGSDPLATGISPASFTPAQPGLVAQDFSTFAGQPSFLSQIQTPADIVGPTSSFDLQAAGLPGGIPTGTSSNLAQLESAGLFNPTGIGTAPGQVAADIAPQVAPINSLEAAGVPNLPAPPPSWFDPTAPGIVPAGPGATEIAATAPAAAPTTETAAAAPAAAAPSTLAQLTQFAPLGTLGLGAAGLGLNIANQLNTPTAANIGAAPRSDALAQTAPAMDANQIRQLLLNEGMSPAQADAYIAQINQRLAAQGPTTGSTDALNQGLVTAG